MNKYKVSKENLKKFKNSKLAVNCKTEEQAKEFIRWCFDNDFKWLWSEDKYIKTYFDVYEKNTCYSFALKLCLGLKCKEYYRKKGFEILTFDEFMGIELEPKEIDYKREYEKLLNENADLKEFIKAQEEYLHKKYYFEINELVKERNKLLEVIKKGE